MLKLEETLARKIHDPSGRWLIDQVITSGQGVLTDAALDKVRLYLRPGVLVRTTVSILSNTIDRN